MGSRTKRREQRNKRRRHADPVVPSFDPHAQVIVDTWATMVELMGALAAADDPVGAIDAAVDDAVAEFVRKVRRFNAFRLIEVARMAFLPMSFDDEPASSAEASAAHVELLALVALTAEREAAVAGEIDPEPVSDQEMSHFVSEASNDLAKLLQLAQLRHMATVDRADKFAMVSWLVRGAEVTIRNQSYPEMLEATNIALLDGEPTVRAALIAELGFDATDALAVFTACHDLQQDRMNDRLFAMRDATAEAMGSMRDGEPDRELVGVFRSAFFSAFEPAADEVTVAVEEVIARTGIAEERVRAVVERFRLDHERFTPAEAVDAFSAGKNPFRPQPLIVSHDGRLMLPHPALSGPAVRESLEERLKKSPAWDKYQKHRGDLLESRTRVALSRVLPGARYRDAFEYFVPATEAEERSGDPAKCTKRVEGDHLVILDDVAIIVEDKAVALSVSSKEGKTTRIRNDLTGIITKAADQGRRMRDRIEHDGGLRIEDEGWVDLRHIREIHTVAVSLDDLSTVLTATAELVRAGLLGLDNIPWTVSLHDFELISELVDRPAEFLLYLRRRRNPDATVMFKAPDELDLFLYFFESGLWVEPDPAKVRSAFPFMPEPTTAELRRYRAQTPSIVSARTDAMDAWFHTRGRVGRASAPKPVMVPSPLATFIDELQARNVAGWLSIGATLLSATTLVQRQFARHADNLLDNPSPDGQGRTMAVPLAASVDPAEGWLLIWATRPANEDAAAAEQRLRNYLRTKKYQLGLPRGVVFLYDETSRALAGVYYDSYIGPLDAELTALLGYLRPASDLQRLHPNAGRTAHRTRSNPRKSPKRKR